MIYLIQRGGGTGPNETRQPAAEVTVPIPAGLYILEDEVWNKTSSLRY